MADASDPTGPWTGRSGRSYERAPGGKVRDGANHRVVAVVPMGEGERLTDPPSGRQLALLLPLMGTRRAAEAVERELGALTLLSEGNVASPAPRLHDRLAGDAVGGVVDWCPTDLEHWWADVALESEALRNLCLAMADVCRRVGDWLSASRRLPELAAMPPRVRPRAVLRGSGGRWVLSDFGAEARTLIEAEEAGGATEVMTAVSHFQSPEELFVAESSHPLAGLTWAVGTTFFTLLKMRAFLASQRGPRRPELPSGGTDSPHLGSHRSTLVEDLLRRKPSLFIGRALDPKQFLYPDRLPDRDRRTVREALAGVLGPGQANLEDQLARDCLKLLDSALSIDASRRYLDPIVMAGDFEGLARRFRVARSSVAAARIQPQVPSSAALSTLGDDPTLESPPPDAVPADAEPVEPAVELDASDIEQAAVDEAVLDVTLFDEPSQHDDEHHDDEDDDDEHQLSGLDETEIDPDSAAAAQALSMLVDDEGFGPDDAPTVHGVMAPLADFDAVGLDVDGPGSAVSGSALSGSAVSGSAGSGVSGVNGSEGAGDVGSDDERTLTARTSPGAMPSVQDSNEGVAQGPAYDPAWDDEPIVREVVPAWAKGLIGGLVLLQLGTLALVALLWTGAIGPGGQVASLASTAGPSDLLEAVAAPSETDADPPNAAVAPLVEDTADAAVDDAAVDTAAQLAGGAAGDEPMPDAANAPARADEQVPAGSAASTVPVAAASTAAAPVAAAPAAAAPAAAAPAAVAPAAVAPAAAAPAAAAPAEAAPAAAAPAAAAPAAAAPAAAAPAAAAEEPVATGNGTITVLGAEARLKGPSGQIALGDVPAGTYTVLVNEGGTWTEACSATVQAGKQTVVRCGFGRCKQVQ